MYPRITLLPSCSQFDTSRWPCSLNHSFVHSFSLCPQPPTPSVFSVSFRHSLCICLVFFMFVGLCLSFSLSIPLSPVGDWVGLHCLCVCVWRCGGGGGGERNTILSLHNNYFWGFNVYIFVMPCKVWYAHLYQWDTAPYKWPLFLFLLVDWLVHSMMIEIFAGYVKN